jgi:uncharacterized protein (TIGR00255 family)
MNSMTGFGRGEASNGAISVVAEITTVNNRFRDVQLRLPREYYVLEPRVQQLLRDNVQRGRVDVTLRRTSAEGAARILTDIGLAEQYYRAAGEIARRIQREPTSIPLEWVLAQPGVLISADHEPDALREWDLCELAIQSALADLGRMRESEGNSLCADLRRHLHELMRYRSEVEASSEGVAERLRQRLIERLTRLISDRTDPWRLAQEAALLAEKADVSEELTRLMSHCEQFGQALDAQEPVGRKLDFLLQEMNREVNTVGSKAAEHPISSRVVEMKSVLERMREQAANVE